jgi:uncharacterized protein YecE (DUF72 family)
MVAYVGTAGWTIARETAGQFPAEGSSLERYAECFSATEINSSFHRPHRPATWQRWALSVPAHFRFSVKVPKEVSHQRKLVDCAEPIAEFLDQTALLAEKLAILLLQLPPKLAFDQAVAEPFLTMLASRTPAQLVCEPRHASWFEAPADSLLEQLRVARVAADPALNEAAARPGGWRGLSYWRLHGSPVMYRSSYADRLTEYATAISADLAAGRDAWCIFDNTASSAATGDALGLSSQLVTV